VAPDHNFKLCIFEENANNARMHRALGHANAINRVQRSKYDIPILCAANCLQVDHENDNGWDQGLLFIDPSRVWGQPSYYVSQMAANNYLPLSVKSVFISEKDTLDITALRSNDGKTISLQIVNSTPKPVTTKVLLNDNKAFAVTITELTGTQLDGWNTAEGPNNIIPVKRKIDNTVNNYTFAPYSFTVVRFEH
jgi:hypothetical protein